MSLKRSAPAEQRDVSPPPVKRKIASATTNSAVSSFFKPASQKPAEEVSWRLVDDSLIIGRYNPDLMPSQARKHPVKIAAFDLDDTLITPTGAKFARGAEGWKWWDPCVPGRLRELHNEGYLVTIFTNQGGVSVKEKNPKSLQKEPLSLAKLKAQVINIFKALDLPISLYGASAQDRYRKPRIGMWEELLEDYDLRGDGAVDMDSSFYIGDAAGRERTDKRKKADWASSDRDLAANIGIRFQTPEEFFLGQDVEPYKAAFDPTTYLSETALKKALARFDKKYKQELVIFCGSPGAGKSTFYWRVLQPLAYARINQDTLKSRDKCLKVARQCLDDQQSVAVDNTNADATARKYWVDLAKEFKIPIRCVWFTTPPRLAEHNDNVRAMNVELMNPEKRDMLPGIAFKSFQQRFQEPKLDEGFDDITTVDFSWQGTSEQQAVWSKHWVSKFST
ncbi:polynucleotide kinase 3'-phosphatase [Cyphellophora europaea CBS 101466]|uniref:Polynucleotide kinase 3'-phosphatase n=1 Tax=Cyphellophora europaea (strain CBS 101466) TaxID=1220924 RepID=W2RQP1_CYPE1|nr:polynucleotide kinase 3'-phosphatase [Cyphellophora europaea CBS 101466]ETN38028.1 polynucleotide kinase 3'-phosphatase [Cyphellophora europaea CBS 101466]